jgi:hypothetical protein
MTSRAYDWAIILAAREPALAAPSWVEALTQSICVEKKSDTEDVGFPIVDLRVKSLFSSPSDPIESMILSSRVSVPCDVEGYRAEVCLDTQWNGSDSSGSPVRSCSLSMYGVEWDERMAVNEISTGASMRKYVGDLLSGKDGIDTGVCQLFRGIMDIQVLLDSVQGRDE